MQEVWFEAIEGLRQRGIGLTPQALTMLTVMLDSVEDYDNVPIPFRNQSSLVDLQRRAIAEIVRIAPVAARSFGNTELLTSLMIMRFIPGVITLLCPFEYPPEVMRVLER